MVGDETEKKERKKKSKSVQKSQPKVCCFKNKNKVTLKNQTLINETFSLKIITDIHCVIKITNTLRVGFEILEVKNCSSVPSVFCFYLFFEQYV